MNEGDKVSPKNNRDRTGILVYKNKNQGVVNFKMEDYENLEVYPLDQLKPEEPAKNILSTDNPNFQMILDQLLDAYPEEDLHWEYNDSGKIIKATIEVHMVSPPKKDNKVIV